MKKFITITLLALLTSCASTDKANEKNPFDAITLKENLHEGKTTQIQIIETFGAPDITTQDENKNDSWTYAKSKTEREGLGIGTGALAMFLPGPLALVGANVNHEKSSTSSKTVTVTMTFDQNKILKGYTISKSKI